MAVEWTLEPSYSPLHPAALSIQPLTLPSTACTSEMLNGNKNTARVQHQPAVQMALAKARGTLQKAVISFLVCWAMWLNICPCYNDRDGPAQPTRLGTLPLCKAGHCTPLHALQQHHRHSTAMAEDWASPSWAKRRLQHVIRGQSGKSSKMPREVSQRAGLPDAPDHPPSLSRIL